MKLTLAAVNDNRPQIDAEFLHLPEAFLQTYSQEILGWAGELTTKGQFLTINLWNPPGCTSIISAGYQGQVTLRWDVLRAPLMNAVRMVIQPDGEQNRERVRQHCEDLPAIMAAHRTAARAVKRGRVEVVIEKIPEYFALRYSSEIRVWLDNLRAIGPVKTIVLREGNLSDMSPEPEQGAVLLGVKLKGAIREFKNDTLVVVVTPNDEQDERIIRKHCEKMEAVGIKPGAQLVEPLRPGMPFMPTISNTVRSDDDAG